jgi:hypothetical protein
LSRNIPQSKDSTWIGGKEVGEQEISLKIYESKAELFTQFCSLDLLYSIIARRETMDNVFMEV